MKFLIIVIIIWGSSGNCPAQDIKEWDFFETKHLITLSTGVSSHSLRDEMMSPLIYSGTRMPLMLTYKYIGFLNRHTLSLYYDNSELTSSITNKNTGTHLIKDLNVNFKYSFSIRAFDIKEINASSFVGFRLSGMLNMRNHYFLADKQQTSAEQITGIGIYFLTETDFPKGSNNNLSAEINIPFISYALLSGRYNANVSSKFDDLDYEKNVLWQLFKNGNIISFNKLFEIQAEISYSYAVTKRIGLNFSYCFQYYNFVQYESLFSSKAINNQFLIGFMVRL